MSKHVLMVLSDGVEDVEAVSVIDVMHRTEIDITTASLSPGPVHCAWGSVLEVDAVLSDVADSEFDGLVLPGGLKNAQNLAANETVNRLIRGYQDEGKLIASICASPAHVLGESAGILKDRRATGDPIFNDKLAAAGAVVTNQHVTVDNNIITSIGPGTALSFGLRIAEYLLDASAPVKWTRAWRIYRYTD